MNDSAQKSDNIFHQLFIRSSDALMLLDENGFFDCNQAALDLLLYQNKEELCSKKPWEHSPPKQLFNEDSKELAQKQISIAQKNGKNFFEWIMRKSNGVIFPAEILLTGLVLNGKQIFLASVRDITARKDIERKLKIFASIIENTEDAVISKDLTGKILSWNKGAENVYGYKSYEIIGQNISIILPKERKDEIKDILDKITKGENIEHYETIRLNKKGEKIYISLTVSPIKNEKGEIIGASTIARNIQKQMEKEVMLEKMNKLMVGRELKMIELKNEIKTLKKRLNIQKK